MAGEALEVFRTVLDILAPFLRCFRLLTIFILLTAFLAFQRSICIFSDFAFKGNLTLGGEKFD